MLSLPNPLSNSCTLPGEKHMQLMPSLNTCEKHVIPACMTVMDVFEKHFKMKTSNVRNEQCFTILMTALSSLMSVIKCSEVFMNMW